MKELDIARLQEQARSAYEAYYARDLISDETAKFSALQVVMQAEIALQLSRIATQLEDDDIVERLSRIGSILQDK